MKTALRFLALLFLPTSGSRAELVAFGGGLQVGFTNIGDAGNAADTTGAPDPATSEDYEFRISTCEISPAQREAGSSFCRIWCPSRFRVEEIFPQGGSQSAAGC